MKRKIKKKKSNRKNPYSYQLKGTYYHRNTFEMKCKKIQSEQELTGAYPIIFRINLIGSVRVKISSSE